MTVTYALSFSGTSGQLNRLRLICGDNDTTAPLLQDEEYAAITANFFTNDRLAGAMACEAIAGVYARQVHTKNGELWVYANERYEHYTTLAASLRAQAYTGAQIYVGGRSQAEKDTRVAAADVIQPSFSRGMDDYWPPTSSTSTG